ncbi:MAG: DNA cytosine methyltransferase [Bacteroidales bacterium]|nr:DNA cytosine methyltransferase [Bacteroidales bacterium]
MKTFTFIDLFAGIGGFRIALESLGGECAFSSEWDKACQRTYEYNFHETPHGDITLEETKSAIPKDFDILCAGFPCQPFSVAGYRKGFEDTRGTLFFEIADVLERHRPKAFILENVKNLLTHDNGNTFAVILRTLRELRYDVHHSVLNTMRHANIPQNRERIFIIGFNRTAIRGNVEFQFPRELKLERSIHDFISSGSVDERCWYTPKSRIYPNLVAEVTDRDSIYQWRRKYVRKNKSNVCPTLTANMGTGGHNVPIILTDGGIRKLTPRECLNFQGFPKRFAFPDIPMGAQYKQAGNAVTVPLVRRVAEEVLKTLGMDHQQVIGKLSEY